MKPTAAAPTLIPATTLTGSTMPGGGGEDVRVVVAGEDWGVPVGVACVYVVYEEERDAVLLGPSTAAMLIAILVPQQLVPMPQHQVVDALLAHGVSCALPA